MPYDMSGVLRKWGEEKKYSQDETYKGFIFGPFKESALNALCIHEENLKYFN